MKKDNTNLDIVFDMNIKKNDMGKKYNKNIVWISWASLFFGICFQFCSCKNKSNSSGNNLTITDSEVPAEKILPEKDIDSPVTFKEERVYSSSNGTIQDGIIIAYDNYVWANSSTYNNDGYLTHFSYKSDSYTEDFDYKYDFSDENYSCVYKGSQKYVYGKDGNLLKQFSKDKLMYLYTYNSKGQEISKIEYNEGKWAYKNLTSFDGNIKTTLVIYNEEGKEIKEQEIKEKLDKKGNVIEKTEYYYNNGIKEKQFKIVYESNRKFSTSYFYNDGMIRLKVVTEYDSHGENIKENFYSDDGDFSSETRREYDKYGNQTLEINKIMYSADRVDVMIKIYNYTYGDGTKFIAKEKYSNLFRNVSANEQDVLENRVDNNINFYDSNMGNCPSSHDTKITTDKKVTKVWHDCALCNGSGTIVYDTNPPLYGQTDYPKYCSTCQRTFMASLGHTHITCKQCHGRKGYYTESY